MASLSEKDFHSLIKLEIVAFMFILKIQTDVHVRKRQRDSGSAPTQPHPHPLLYSRSPFIYFYHLSLNDTTLWQGILCACMCEGLHLNKEWDNKRQASSDMKQWGSVPVSWRWEIFFLLLFVCLPCITNSTVYQYMVVWNSRCLTRMRQNIAGRPHV